MPRIAKRFHNFSLKQNAFIKKAKKIYKDIIK